MAAPLALRGTGEASKAVAGVIKVLSTDIIRAEGIVYRRIRKRVARLDAEGRVQLTKKGRVRYRTVQELEPIQLEAHLNPIGIGILGAGLAVGAALLFGRFRVGVPGVGVIELYNGPLADEFESWKQARRPKESREAALAECLAQCEFSPIRAICEATCRARFG